ncbi:MAG TPA: hypothetical protein VMU39_26505 [Solirubrobacteraceae bacterium]|nr:hypothetical protein [Solirubrobacteraceae bacterium]
MSFARLARVLQGFEGVPQVGALALARLSVVQAMPSCGLAFLAVLPGGTSAFNSR